MRHKDLVNCYYYYYYFFLICNPIVQDRSIEGKELYFDIEHKTLPRKATNEESGKR